jgi:hypothetical protein
MQENSFLEYSSQMFAVDSNDAVALSKDVMMSPSHSLPQWKAKETSR